MNTTNYDSNKDFETGVNMATRSFIGILNKDNTVDYIYCHWDGYPDYNGVLLVENYSNIDDVRDLISLGDLSSLAPNISAPEGCEHSFESRYKDVCVFYGRDRGDVDVSAKKTTVDEYLSKSFGDSSWVEYRYLFDPSMGWKVTDSEGPVSLMVLSGDPILAGTKHGIALTN
ncbi:MAG: hypothetical protein EBT66_08830 [Bacteroidetes bacterium]|jgi:hypothetical protein|nr:hypothetical protein [Bacteroidota bacterium]